MAATIVELTGTWWCSHLNGVMVDEPQYVDHQSTAQTNTTDSQGRVLKEIIEAPTREALEGEIRVRGIVINP